jgi:hypothetical protein
VSILSPRPTESGDAASFRVAGFHHRRGAQMTGAASELAANCDVDSTMPSSRGCVQPILAAHVAAREAVVGEKPTSRGNRPNDGKRSVGLHFYQKNEHRSIALRNPRRSAARERKGAALSPAGGTKHIDCWLTICGLL